ncbi:MAG: DegV family protein [Atopobiaceae bacterium]
MLTIVTDSTSCLTRGEASSLGVVMLPMTYILDGERHREGAQGTYGSYQQAFQAATFVGTEPIYPSEFERTFRELLSVGNDVLCITMSSRLSGAYRAACEARDALDSHDVSLDVGSHLCVFDSGYTVSALEHVVRRARQLAGEGRGLFEVAQELEGFRSRVRLEFAVPSMDPLRSSGRLGAVRRSVGGVLDHYPVFCVEEGAIRTLGAARGTSGAAHTLTERVPEGVASVTVCHFGDAGKLARHTMIELRRRVPKAKILVKDGGPVISARIGVGSVSLSWVQGGANDAR